MRFFPKALLATALAVLAAGDGLAATVIFDWQGQGRSEVFTIPGKLASWTAAWDCQAHTSPAIAVLNADAGTAVDYLGASYRGEKLLSKTGRFQLDTGGTFCRVTVTLSD